MEKKERLFRVVSKGFIHIFCVHCSCCTCHKENGHRQEAAWGMEQLEEELVVSPPLVTPATTSATIIKRPPSVRPFEIQVRLLSRHVVLSRFIHSDCANYLAKQPPRSAGPTGVLRCLSMCNRHLSPVVFIMPLALGLKLGRTTSRM